MRLKIYQITNTGRFFDQIFKCKGSVEIISKDGLHISLNDHGNTENLSALAASYVDGNINEIELSLTCHDDIIRMMQYVYGMRRSA